MSEPIWIFRSICSPRRVARRDEIDQTRFGHVGNVFVGADAVESGHLERREITSTHLESPPGMCKSYGGSLRLGPFQNRHVPSGPVLNPLCSRIILLMESQQNQVSSMAGRETGYFQIVVH